MRLKILPVTLKDGDIKGSKMRLEKIRFDLNEHRYATDEPSPCLIDKEVIGEIQEVLAPKDFALRLRQLMNELENGPELLFKLFAEQHMLELSKAAHGLAGLAAVFGAKGLHELLIQLEISSPKITAHQTALSLKKIQQTTAQCLDYYEQLLAQTNETIRT